MYEGQVFGPTQLDITSHTKDDLALTKDIRRNPVMKPQLLAKFKEKWPHGLGKDTLLKIEQDGCYKARVV